MKKFEGCQKGVNLGGWISQFDRFDHEHFKTFITETDIEYIASLGFDHVRVPVDYNVLEDEEGHPLDTGFQYLHNCHAWCKKHGLHMLIDLHECFGYSFDPLKKDMDREKFFYDEALQARFLKLWETIATHFKDDADSVAFEALNEVVLFEVADAWNKVVAKWVKTIRTVAPDHYLVYGGVRYNNVMSVPLLEKQDDPKIVYNFHCYEPLIFTHQGAYWVDDMPSDLRVNYPESLEVYREKSKGISNALAGAIFSEEATSVGPEFFENIFMPAVRKAEEDDVPLYCGEYGVIDLADNHAKINWLKDIHATFNKYGIGRSLWNYKEKDFGFVDERFASIKDKFIACL